MTEKYKVFILLVVAALLRLWDLGKAPFWYDEAFTGIISRLPWLRMVQATAGDTHPPLYYAIVWPIGQLGITAEWAYRLPSVIASVASIYVLWLILDKLEYPKAARWGACILMAVLPSQLHYSQEARMYALLQLLVLLTYLAILCRQRPLVILFGWLVMMTHNYGMFYYAVLGVLAYWRWVGFKWNWRAALDIALPVLLFVPWLAVVVLVQMAEVSGGYWIQQPSIGGALYALYMAVFAFGMPDAWQLLAMMIVLALLAFGLWRFVEQRPPGWIDALALAFGPMVIALVVSYAWRPIFLFRGLFPSAAFLYMILVYRLATHERRGLQLYAAALLLPVVVAGMYGHYTYNPPNKGQGDLLSQVAYVRYLASNDYFPPGQQDRIATIVHSNDSSWIGWAWYAPEQNHVRLIDPPCPGQKTLGSLSLLTRQAIGVQEISPANITPPAFVAWSLGPTASQCDETQTYLVLEAAEPVMVISDTEYISAGLWVLP